MSLGIHLTLLIGPTVPILAPPQLVLALASAEVTHNDEGRSGFQLTFNTGRTGVSDIFDYPLFTNPLLRPFNRVILLVTFGFFPRVLIDGIITNQQFQPAREGGTATLTLTGQDVSIMMDREEKSAEHIALTDNLIVTKILFSYFQYVPLQIVFPPVALDPALPIERTPTQQGTDYKFITALAARYGYVFYVIPGPFPGSNTAYWGPPKRVDTPQAAITLDMGVNTNAEEINFHYDAAAPTMIEGSVRDRRLNQTLPVMTFASTRPPLVTQPAWLVNMMNNRRQQFRESGLDVVQAYGRAQGTTDASTDVLRAEGTLDAVRYGNLLMPRGLVGVRGTGYNHDGLYYVKSVTHNISPGEYKQRFTLTREGMGSITPILPVSLAMPGQFFGKYRGTVVNNLDPLQLGRVQVSCPPVLGSGQQSWAMPCAPYAGSGVGFFAIPPSGANIWVEFEGGDPDYPIWSGCFWGIGEVPNLPALAEIKVFKTDNLTLTLSDLPGIGGFTLEVNPPAVISPLKIVCDSSGIELSNGANTVKLTLVSVSINDGALEVILCPARCSTSARWGCVHTVGR